MFERASNLWIKSADILLEKANKVNDFSDRQLVNIRVSGGVPGMSVTEPILVMQCQTSDSHNSQMTEYLQVPKSNKDKHSVAKYSQY